MPAYEAHEHVNWSQVPCFAGLNASIMAHLDKVALRHNYQAGAVIFCENEACAGFHVVMAGMVRIYRTSPEGRTHTLSLLKPPATFNEVAAVDGGTNPYNAVATMNTTIARISHAQLMELLSSDRHLLQNYVQALAHVNRDYIERLEDMTFRTIPSRLAKLFLHETTYADQIAEAPSQLNQEEIASILGTTREVVGRALRNLLTAGLLKKKGRQVFIADRAGLEYLAETNLMPETIEPVKCPIK